MTDPTGAVPQDDSTPAATAEPVVPLTPPAYDASPYIAPAAPVYDAAAQETTPYPEASAAPIYAPPPSPTSPYEAYPQAPYAQPQYPQALYPQTQYAQPQYPHAQYPVQTVPGAPPVMPYGYSGYAPPAPVNGFSITSLVLSILGFIWILPIIGSLGGAIFGHLALNQIKRTGASGRGMALAGVIVGWVGLAFALFVVLMFFVIFATASHSYRSGYGA